MFNFKVLECNGTWGPWTGYFKDATAAREWHRVYGGFFEGRGHVFALFNMNKRVAP